MRSIEKARLYMERRAKLKMKPESRYNYLISLWENKTCSQREITEWEYNFLLNLRSKNCYQKKALTDKELKKFEEIEAKINKRDVRI